MTEILGSPQKRNIREMYDLPEKVRYCKKCTISNQRPRITFDEDGVCSACNYSAFKRRLNWEKREAELIALCDRHRRNDGRYDVIVPVSGGKDGSFVAHQLKVQYGMHPLTVTWSPNIYTDLGWDNLRNFIDSGFDNILGTPNGQVNRKLMELAFVNMGDPFQPFIYGQTNFPLRVAVEKGISLIMYGENGEVEYGGDMKNALSPTREIADHDAHYFSGRPPEFWQDHGVTAKDLHPYTAPPFAEIVGNKTEIHFLGYYKYWDPQENFYYSVEHTNFAPNMERNEGTYSKYASLDDKIDGFHYWLAFIKFGIGRTTSDTAQEIRANKISREEGVVLIKKYDGEFPKKHFQQFLDYAGIDEDTFWRVVDSWRGDHVWGKNGNDWVLKNPIWNESNK